jgi:hypothetical protein
VVQDLQGPGTQVSGTGEETRKWKEWTSMWFSPEAPNRLGVPGPFQRKRLLCPTRTRSEGRPLHRPLFGKWGPGGLLCVRAVQGSNGPPAQTGRPYFQPRRSVHGNAQDGGSDSDSPTTTRGARMAHPTLLCEASAGDDRPAVPNIAIQVAKVGSRNTQTIHKRQHHHQCCVRCWQRKRYLPGKRDHSLAKGSKTKQIKDMF